MLGDLPGGGSEGVAYAVSADGWVIVGYSTDAAGIHAFRWTVLGMQPYPVACATSSIAYAVSSGCSRRGRHGRHAGGFVG